jgi:hypothetical protein
MDQLEKYTNIIQNINCMDLYLMPHKSIAAYPTGIVIIGDISGLSFPFTMCPVYFCKPGNSILPGNNPHDIILEYNKDSVVSLEDILYSLMEGYKISARDRTEYSMKRYVYEKKIPPRKIIIPCFKRRENLVAVLKRFQMIAAPPEGYRPQILLVEHSHLQETEYIANDFNCEYIWFNQNEAAVSGYIDDTPIGQFNKALCYDKAFLFSSPAEWYLFHDNDVLVPNDFWTRLDANVQRTGTKFLQPYTHRSLLNLYPYVADMIREDPALVDQGIHPGMYAPIKEGAPGGSLYIHRDRYIDVGGHDPNLCWGYGPEDRLFYNKLQLFEPISFADDPPIEMIHLWHSSAAVNNHFLDVMNWFVFNYYEQLPLEEKMCIMRTKKKMLLDILESRQLRS